jgi:hypothetical protein
MMRKAKVGDVVQVSGYVDTATVVDVLKDVPGGVRLDKYIGDFRYWNIDELTLVWRKRS